MTMLISVKNEDPTRTARVEVQDFSVERRTIACVDLFELAPGMSRAVHIHAARQVVVTENPLAEIPKP